MTDSDAPRREASDQLQRLLADEWEQRMQDDPLFATRCGDHRFNDRLPVVSASESARRLAQTEEFLRRLQAIARDALSPADQLNYDLFERELKDRIGRYTFHTHLMPIYKTSGFHVGFAEQPNVVPLRTIEDYENYTARLAGFKAYTDGHIELMRAGMRAGFVPADANTVCESAEILRRGMLQVYPQLREVAVEYAWGGTLGFTFDLLPHAGTTADGLHYALGCGGHGVALLSYLGACVAQRVAGERIASPLFSLPFPTARCGRSGGSRGWGG